MRYCRERGYRVDELRGVEPLPERGDHIPAAHEIFQAIFDSLFKPGVMR